MTYNLASELGISVTADDKIVNLCDKTTKSKFFTNDDKFMKDTFTTNVENQNARNSREKEFRNRGTANILRLAQRRA